MYKNMEEFLKQELKKEAEEELKKVQNDPDVKDLKVPEAFRERLFAEIDKREQEERIKRTAEEEELIEMGRLYLRSRKKHKYFVLAAVLVLAFAFSVTAVGGPRKVVESIRRMFMGRTQIEMNVDTKNIDTIYSVDEEEGYQQVKDEWGADPVRMQYFPSDVVFENYNLNKVMQIAQFIYTQNGKAKIMYQIMPNKGTSSQGADMEEAPRMEYSLEVLGQTIAIKGFETEEKENYRWIVRFVYQELQYFMVVEDETQSNLEEIVQNLNFF